MVCVLLTLYEGGIGQLDVQTAVERVSDRLRRAVDPRLRAGFTTVAAVLLEWADQHDEARTLIDRELLGIQPVGVDGAPDLTNHVHQLLVATHAHRERKEGRFQQVIAEITPLLDSARDTTVQLPYFRAMVADAWYELGRPDLARRQLDILGPPPDTAIWTWDEVLCVRARHHYGYGRWEQALADDTTLGERMARRVFVNPVGQPWRRGAALALTRLGHHEQARELAAEHLRHAEDWGAPRHVGTALRTLALTQRGRGTLDGDRSTDALAASRRQGILPSACGLRTRSGPSRCRTARGPGCTARAPAARRSPIGPARSEA
ncbi:hypothetical protein ACFVIM_08455 [Streptomyces sp. NPDC057638]|uniref:hypothetical protein n=1 Tax=Streptomyces sp. NPDC057638 TaxID=3346190 RepID=UPI0036AFBE8C